MYTKPAMKYKYRGHKFAGPPEIPYPLYEYDVNQMKEDKLDTTPNSMLANKQSNSIYVEPKEMPTSDITSGTSLFANTNINKPTVNNESSIDLAGVASSIGSLYAPYAAATNFTSEAQNLLLKQAANGKGGYAKAYNDIVASEVAKGATQEAAAKAASEQIGSKIASWAGPVVVGATGVGEAVKGWNEDFSGSPYDKDAAKAAAWNIKGDNPLTYNPNVTAWSNIAGNYKDYLKGLKGVNFDSNTESQRSLGHEWDNANLLDITKSDLKRGDGRSILDTAVATGKGALMGSAASGNWIGALVGAGVGLGEDIFNKVKARKQKKEILKEVNNTNQRMFQQAQNRDQIIEELNTHRDMLNYKALGGKLFDQGGPMLTKFDTGGSHEENPFGGIPQGTAPDGQPNLVEQGETKWDDEDYVFSKRLTINKRLVKEYNLPKDFIGKTFAYATQKFDEKFNEHENDAISIATQNAILSRTQEAQEALRADMEMKQLTEQMKNLTPEEQQTLLAQYEQQPMETQQMQYPTDSETMQGGMPQESNLGQGYALGGHLFGGGVRKQIYNALGIQGGQTALQQWANDNEVELPEDWTSWDTYQKWANFLQTNAEVIAKTKPSLGYMLQKGYNPFAEGFETPVNNAEITNDNEKSNWDKSSLVDFLQSDDAVVHELNSKGTDKPTLQDIKNTNAYRQTTQWLQSEENGKKYLQSIAANSKSAKAKKWANDRLEELEAGKQYNYQTMIGAKREDIYPGTYWRSVADAVAQDNNINYIQNPDGTWDIVESDIDPKWKGAGNYTTYDATGTPTRTTHNFYTRPSAAPQNNLATTDETVPDNPELLPTWMRGVGAVLPFMYLNQKADYSNADMIQAPKIGFSPIADYLKYRPLDKQYYLNSAMARQQNLRNNIINTSGGNRAAATNNLMIADLQAQDELGKLYETAEMYNADQRQKVAAQNADVNKFNSQGFFNADQWNAQAEFQARQARAQMRHNIDAATAQTNGANLTQGIQNLIDIGDENARLNSINTNPAWAAMRGTDGQIFFKAMQEYAKNHPEAKDAACGGYLTIKKRRK